MTTTEPAATSPPARPARSAHQDARPTRPGVSVRVRITGTVAVLVAAALTLAGLVVYLIESERIEEQVSAGAQQELDEFARVEDPGAGLSRATLRGTLEGFLERNVPDEGELLLGWVDDGPTVGFPRDDRLVDDPDFQAQVQPLVASGGSRRIDTYRGDALVSAQPVRENGQSGAMVVVSFLSADQAGLRDTMRTYAFVALAALLLVVAAAFLQVGRLLSPLRMLRQTAAELTESDLSGRLPVRGNDDVTALTRTFNSMVDRLEAAFVGQREFLDDAGHELKTPLTVVRGHLELLDAGDPDEVAETRELLLDETDRMARLVGDLILLAKSDRPDFLTTAPVDLVHLTETVLAKARGLGDRHWVLDGTAAVVIDVDEQRITQALLQLADNAVKHTADGDEVAVGSSALAGVVQLWVRDTGPGVPAAERDRIFERFGRVDAAPTDEGFGLGLSIVRAIAHAHGGDVRLDLDHAEGARFVITLTETREV